MVEISQGSRTALLNSMSTMGANNLIVQAGAATSGGVTWGRGSAVTLTPEDAEEIQRQCPAVQVVAPVIETRGQVIYGNRNWVPMNIYGTTPAFLDVRDWRAFDEGVMFGDQDVRGATKVCVIGRTLVKELFGATSPVGKTIRVKNVSLRVLGVLSQKGANMIGMDQDDVVIMPWTTLKFRVSGENTSNAALATASQGSSATAQQNSLNSLYPGKTVLYPERSATQLANNPQVVRFVNVDRIQVKAASSDEIKTAIAQITALLQDRHRIRNGEPDDFNIRDMSEFLKMMTSTSQMTGSLLLIVAFISLAVGGVGIMNIMLVSVTERTREIGLRMAVGARSHHILKQFLIEAVVLCLLGGAVGIIWGRAASLLVWYTMKWPVQASLIAVIAAFGVSATIGIVFGFYPAWKASRLDPIEALRYE
jgi:ABC-type antimicrobial peptide transport system permease subunit